jgi:hypothetical protein
MSIHSADYDAPFWLAEFVRNEVRPFFDFDLALQAALAALARWRAYIPEKDMYLRQLAEGSAPPEPRAYNEPPLDLPLPPLRNRNWTCDQCLIALLAVHDETRDPKDRIVSTEIGIYAALCLRVRDLRKEDLPDLRAMLKKASACLQLSATGPGTMTAPAPQYVTLDQMAALVSRSKKTLERLKTRKDNPLPSPAVEGGGGKADEWIWSEVRPWLEQEFRRPLPERLPARTDGH